MREKESSVGIVRIRIGIGVLVMLPVITYPNVQAILTGERVQPQQYDLDGTVRFERAMRPQSMCAHCHAQTGQIDERNGCSCVMRLEDLSSVYSFYS